MKWFFSFLNRQSCPYPIFSQFVVQSLQFLQHVFKFSFGLLQRKNKTCICSGFKLESVLPTVPKQVKGRTSLWRASDLHCAAFALGMKADAGLGAGYFILEGGYFLGGRGK